MRDQLLHLAGSTPVQQAFASGRPLILHGWVYDIADGEVYAYDDKNNVFEPVSKRYAAEVAKHLALAHKHD